MTGILGRKEGVKDLFQILFRDAMTRIRKFHFDALINRVESRRQIQFSITIHRICCIDDDINKNAFYLRRVYDCQG